MWPVPKSKPKFNKPITHHYLKPWQDPESLFCSPKLKEIIGKEPLKDEECRDASWRKRNAHNDINK